MKITLNEIEKKYLIFISGIVLGIISTVLVWGLAILSYLNYPPTPETALPVLIYLFAIAFVISIIAIVPLRLIRNKGDRIRCQI